MFTIMVTAIVFVVFFGIGLALIWWPQKIQAYDLKNIGDPDKVSRKVPQALRPFAKKAKGLAHSSKTGAEYLTVLRLIGVFWIAIVILALVLILRRYM